MRNTISICTAIALISVAGGLRAQDRRLALDDVLLMERFGSAAIDPSGRWLVYERVRPYEQLDDYSYWLYAYSISGHQLWLVDMASDGEPHLLPGLDPLPSSYIVDFSPSGRYLVAVQHQRGNYAFASCDLERARCVRFAETPDVHVYYGAGFLKSAIVWTSDETFVFPALPEGERNPEMRARAHVGEALWSAWNRAWSGEGVTAQVSVSTARDRSQDWANGALIEANVRTGETRILGDGRYMNGLLSPDGKWIAAGRASVRAQFANADGDAASDDIRTFDRRYQLTLIDPDTKARKAFDTPYHVDPSSFVWSHDSQRLAFFGWPRGAQPQDGRFHVLDVEVGAVEAYDHSGLSLSPRQRVNSLSVGPARAALTDEGLAVFARAGEAPARELDNDRHDYDWYLLRLAERPVNLTAGLDDAAITPLHVGTDRITVLAEGGLFRVYTDGRAERLGPRIDHALVDITLGAGRRFLYGRGGADSEASGVLSWRDDAGAKIILVDYGDGATRVVEAPSAQADPLVASPSTGAALFAEKEGQATRLLLTRPGQEPRELARINDHLNTIALGKPRTVRYTLQDPEGLEPPRELEACVLLPPNYQQGKRYPLVFNIYPRERSSCATLEGPSATTPYLWAARGFIYVGPAMPLDLIRTHDGPIAGMDEIAVQTVDALVDQGFVDPDRVVLFGFSQGGISSLYTATQTDRFAAVVSMNGWADFFSHYFDGRGLYRYFHVEQGNRWRYDGVDGYRPFGFGVPPYDDPAVYARMSPVALARGITSPILLIHSDLDYFGLNQYDEMFNALYRLRKEARYVRYWGEGHGPSSPANIRDMWERIDAFLAEAIPRSE